MGFVRSVGGMVVAASLPLGGAWYATRGVEQYLTREVNQTLETSAAALATKAEGFWDMNVKALQQNAASPDITSMDPARQRPILQSLTRAYPHLFLAFTAGRDGVDIARSDEKAHMAFGDRRYFQAAMRGAPLAHEVLMGKTSGKPTLVLATPILGADRLPIGALVTSAQLRTMSDAVGGLRAGATGAAWLVDDAGRVIAATRRGVIFESSLAALGWHPGVEYAVDQLPDRPLQYEYEGVPVVARTARTPQGWAVIVQQDYSEAFGPLLAARRGLQILALGTLAVILLLARVLTHRRAARPIPLTAEVVGRVTV